MSTPEDRDQKLIQALIKGDQRTYRVFVLRYQQRIYQLCYRMLNDSAEAEDMAQETFIRVFKSISHFRGESSLNTWIHRIALNLCKNRIEYLKRRQYGKQKAISEMVGDTWESDKTYIKSESLSAQIDSPQQIMEGKEAQEFIEQALQSLDEDLRALLILRDIQGLNYQEISRVTGFALGTVKSRIHRARKVLMERYQELQGAHTPQHGKEPRE